MYVFSWDWDTISDAAKDLVLVFIVVSINIIGKSVVSIFIAADALQTPSEHVDAIYSACGVSTGLELLSLHVRHREAPSVMPQTSRFYSKIVFLQQPG